MALIDISQLPTAIGLTGAEQVPLVQDGTTKRAAASLFAGGAAASAQAANVVFAGPTSGADAAPSFRALVEADIPASPPPTAEDANTFYAGPTSGSPAVPSFRAIVAADIADLPQSSSLDWVSPIDYGLVADGAVHPLSDYYATLAEAQVVYPFATSLTQQIDYCATKAAANVCFGEDGSEHGSDVTLNRPLYLPHGSYWFGYDTLLIRNLAGGMIQGAGRQATQLRGNATLLAFDGIWYTRIGGFSVVAATTGATAAMELDGNVPGHPYATRGVQGVTLFDMLIDGGMSDYALAMCRQGGASGQGSECSFQNLHLSSASFACYYQSGFNALANQFFGGNCQSYTTNGIYVTGGTISVYGTGFQSTYGYTQYENDGWDINVGSSGSYEGVPIYGCRTESMRFLLNEGAVNTDVRACVGRSAMVGWFANTPYGPLAALGKAIQVPALGRVFVATTPGTSGGSEPTWPTNGSPVVDGSITWTETVFDAINIAYGTTSAVDPRTVTMSIGRMNVPPRDISTAVSADHTVTSDDIVLADATSGPITVTLPLILSGSRGRVVTVRKVDTSANAVTMRSQNGAFDTNGSLDETIPGGSRGWRTAVYQDGAAGVRYWQIINETPPADLQIALVAQVFG